MITKRKEILILIILFIGGSYHVTAQSSMANIFARKTTSLNGDWKVIIDPVGSGDYRQVWLEKKPEKKTDFYEYSFDEGPVLHVPGDFNTQIPELMYMESTVWYKKTFDYVKKNDQRLFLHFGAVNYLADVYLNGKLLGSHEGGFTPFQFELSGLLVDGRNTVVVKVNNQRRKDGIPGMGYDWFNYGGITRDVNLIETANVFIEDYFIQLDKYSDSEILGWVKLSQPASGQQISLRIPELKINQVLKTNETGYAEVKLSCKPQRWTPENPKLYKVILESGSDTITEQIGFRNIEVRGTALYLNGKPLFLRGVNIHEERPFSPARANSEADALILLTWAKEMGCNMARLSHYPHSEYMVRLAERMGILVWDEIPVYQHVEFSAQGFREKMELMMKEMMQRDRNRCAVIVWSLSNETYTTTPGRTDVLVEMTRKCRNIDSTRLITSVLSNQGYSDNTFNVWDTLCRHLDIIAINEYLGWYAPWQGKPSETKWKFVTEKPLIISEFGGEAKYGSNNGPVDEAASWSEAYQEEIYKKQTEMFDVTPNLVGLCPWLLVDYRSPVRMHPVHQGGFNRKGLLSEYGEKKKAWFIMKEYYSKKTSNY
jgi:beta-glucuronidase